MKKGLLTANAEAGTRDAFQRTGVIKKNIIIIIKPDNLVYSQGQQELKLIDFSVVGHPNGHLGKGEGEEWCQHP